LHTDLEHDAEKCEAVFGQHHALTDEHRSRLWFWIDSIQNHRDLAELWRAQQIIDAWYIACGDTLSEATADEKVRFTLIGGR